MGTVCLQQFRERSGPNLSSGDHLGILAELDKLVVLR